MSPNCFTVLFSSVAALLGSPGQANYSAANAALDAAAASSSASGLPSLSVQWGAWAGGGMAAGDPGTEARVQRTGMALVIPKLGLRALATALTSATLGLAPAVVSVTPFVWEIFLGRFRTVGRESGSGGGRVPSLFAELAAAEVKGRRSLIVSSAGTEGGSRRGMGASAPASRSKDQVRGIRRRIQKGAMIVLESVTLSSTLSTRQADFHTSFPFKYIFLERCEC